MSMRLLAAVFVLLLAAAPATAQTARPQLRAALLEGVEADAPLLQDDEASFRIGRDKVQHFVVSALLVLAGQYVAQEKLGMDRTPALALSCGGAFSVGLAKEVYDYRDYGLFSVRDLVADGLGVGTGAVVVVL